MQLTISINLDNSAFEVPGEIQRILSNISEDIEILNHHGQAIIKSGNSPNFGRWNVKDMNGNTIGSFTL